MVEDIISKSIISPLFERMLFSVIKFLFALRNHDFDWARNSSIRMSGIVEAENGNFVCFSFIDYLDTS